MKNVTARGTGPQNLFATAALYFVCASAWAGALLIPDHVVMVVEENRAFSNIIGYGFAPYINALAQSGALMTSAYATDGASQPNYLQLFSGSNQGVSDNTIQQQPFNTPNLSSALAANGLTFTGYSESLPSVGFTGASSTTVPGQNQYVRKHNPWVNWQGASANAVSPEQTQPLTSFPVNDFSALPTVSIVVPNEQHNMHDGGRAAGDTWLQQNLDAYVQWANTHNSLFVLTWDEDDGKHGNHIATLFLGPMVVPGLYDQAISHLNVLRTLEDMYGLDYMGDTAGVAPIANAFLSDAAVPEPPTLALLATGVFFPLLGTLCGRAGQSRRQL
jgi:hypothetical protein